MAKDDTWKNTKIFARRSALEGDLADALRWIQAANRCLILVAVDIDIQQDKVVAEIEFR